jgi:hypothetical protein
MPVPSVDIDKQSVNMLPADQRLPLWQMFVQTLNSAAKRLLDVFTKYRAGDTSHVYDSGTTYDAGDTAQYNFQIWESLQGSNTGNTPDVSPAWWILRNSNFIGAVERTKYNGRYLTLTYALNKQFGTTFKAPPYPSPYGGSGTFSDIYITNAGNTQTEFMMSGPALSYSYVDYSTGFMFTPPVYGSATTFKFIIHIPSAVYTALGATDAVRESVVRGFADKYVPAGIFYNITTY